MNGTILVLGTSEGVEKENNSYDLFPKLVQAKIFTEYGRQTLFINKAISNTTTADCINNMPWWSKITPDLIIYCGIGNDCVKDAGEEPYTERVTTAQCAVNLQVIYNKMLEIISPKGNIIFTMPWEVATEAEGGAARPNHEAYRTVLSNFCNGGNTRGHIIDMPDFRTAWVQAQWAENLYDYNHPNETGSDKLLPIIWPYVNSKVKNWLR